MTQCDQFDSAPIQPVYSQSEPNEAIEYGFALIESNGNDTKRHMRSPGRFRGRFTHDHVLEIVIPEHTATSDDAGADVFARITEARSRVVGGPTKFRFVDYRTTFQAFCTHSGQEKSVWHPASSPLQVRQQSGDISRAVFHLFNWPMLRGPRVYVLQEGKPPQCRLRTCGRFQMECDGWLVTVAELERTEELVNRLSDTGGYAITHVGEVQRSDGRTFSTTQLDDLLACVGDFFSMVLGRWSRPSLTVGFDSAGNRVFEQWGLHQTTMGHYVGGNSFFDRQHDEIFEALFPAFWRLWNDPLWATPLKKAIYWYIGANNVGFGVNVDSALLFSQAALELLSWTYCVLDRKAVSEKAFAPRGGLTASDKLTLLTSLLGISNSLPIELKALDARPGQRWSDSMHAITDLRNGLVHPKENDHIAEDAYHQAWKLSLWYLDLILLRLLKYEGKYSNRLKVRFVGQIEDVPWK